jgi:hypothetical protein
MTGKLPNLLIIRPPQEDDDLARITRAAIRPPPPPAWSRNYAAARGLYRIFNAAGYRFYRKLGSAPAETDTPFATNASLPYQPAVSFTDGTWYLSMSYFNGCIDSGFLPVGPQGQTYLTITVSSGVAAAAAPSQPNGATLQIFPGNVARVTAFYLATPDGVNRATQWAIHYTTDGSTPSSNAPNLTVPMSAGAMQVLQQDFSIPAGVTVNLQLQVRRTTPSNVYSTPLAILTAVNNVTPPSAPVDLQAWVGQLPSDF